jgi:hypothetical protein
MDVLRFQEHQKELTRARFNEVQKRVESLESVVDALRAENRELQGSLAHYAKGEERPLMDSECLIPGIIPGTKLNGKRRGKGSRDEFFEIPVLEHTAERTTTAVATTESVAKLFTPTLARRLQTLTGKKVYGPVQGHD